MLVRILKTAPRLGDLEANRVGCENGIIFSGCSHIIDPHGDVIESLPLLKEGQAMNELPKAHIRSYILRDEKFISSLHELKRIRKKTSGH